MVQTEAEKQFYKAVSNMEEGNIAGATDLLLELTSRFPEFGKAYSYLGVIYFRHFKDAATAESHYKKAISSSPEFTESYINYSALLLSQERFAEMNANLNKVSEITGVKKDKVYELFGLMNELQAKYDEAIGFYKKAIGITFSDEDLGLYEKAINRCNAKKKYL